MDPMKLNESWSELVPPVEWTASTSTGDDIYRWYADTIVYRCFGPLIGCCGLVGGLLSLIVFRRKALRKKSCSVYFFYLALADLLAMLCWLIHFVLPTYHIHLLNKSNVFCKLFVFLMYFTFDLANYILTACSIDRAMSVLFPLRSRKYCDRRVASRITLMLLVVHTLLNGHFLYGFQVIRVPSRLNSTVSICHPRKEPRAYRQFFSTYDSYVDVIKTNVIPFVLMSVCNSIIIVRVCRSTSSLRSEQRELTQKSKRKVEKDRQLTLMLLGSAMAFLLFTLPTEINDIIRSHSQEKLVTEKSYLLSAILLSLAHLNYAVHFYIYTLTGEVFRQQLLKLWPIEILWPSILTLIRCQKSATRNVTAVDDDERRGGNGEGDLSPRLRLCQHQRFSSPVAS